MEMGAAIAIGLALGVAFGNIGIGLVIGVAIGAALSYRNREEPPGSDTPDDNT